MTESPSTPSSTVTPTSAADAERGYTLQRTFDAPRTLVWAAITQPDQFGQWFGPVDSHLEGTQMDVRVGGRWSTTMVVPDMGDIPWQGEYLEVDEPSHLVMTLNDQGVLGEASRSSPSIWSRPMVAPT